MRLEFWHGLFGDRARVDRLNEIAGGAIGLIQRSMWDDILIGLARLFDPPSMGKHSNLSLRTLVNEYGLPQDKARRVRVEELLDAAPVNELKVVRDKLISHNAREWKLGQAPKTGFYYGMEKRLLEAAQNVLHEINLDLNDAGYIWEWSDSSNAADRLFKVLDNGRRHEEELAWLERHLLAEVKAGCPVSLNEFKNLGGFWMKAL
ncbi:MAG: hypothetical protein AAGB48_12970 [Planctomycetota bacterium]